MQTTTGYRSTNPLNAPFVVSYWWGQGIRPPNPRFWINPTFPENTKLDRIAEALQRISALLGNEMLDNAVSSAATPRRARM